jgi:hypothetical protein
MPSTPRLQRLAAHHSNNHYVYGAELNWCLTHPEVYACASTLHVNAHDVSNHGGHGSSGAHAPALLARIIDATRVHSVQTCLLQARSSSQQQQPGHQLSALAARQVAAYDLSNRQTIKVIN